MVPWKSDREQADGFHVHMMTPRGKDPALPESVAPYMDLPQAAMPAIVQVSYNG